MDSIISYLYKLISNKKVTPICSCSKFHFYGTCNCNNKLKLHNVIVSN